MLRCIQSPWHFHWLQAEPYIAYNCLHLLTVQVNKCSWLHCGDPMHFSSFHFNTAIKNCPTMEGTDNGAAEESAFLALWESNND